MEQEKVLFTESEWKAAVPKVTQEMHAHTSQFATAISKDLGDYGEAWGTGAYLRLADRIFIVTNQHVAKARSTERLLHQPQGQDDLWLIDGNHLEFPLPLDVALLPLDSVAWSNRQHESRAIPLDKISIAHATAPTELLTLAGYAGENSAFHFDMLFTPGTTSTSREVDLPPEDERFNAKFHFGLDYRPDLATTVIGTRGLPQPRGFSGSLVWCSISNFTH